VVETAVETAIEMGVGEAAVSSDTYESLRIAALDVDEDVDQEAGESPEGV
jgi:hypothetical protein